MIAKALHGPEVRPTDSGKVPRYIWGIMAVGIGLRLWQFAGFTALGFDETSLARNIGERSYGQLLRPLDYGQIAPAGFLLLERLLWTVFHTDWSLRLIAVGGAVASVPLFYALARRVLTGAAVPLALAAFALGIPFIEYGAQVKQYSTDVTLTLLILLLAVRLTESAPPGFRHAPAGVIGCGAVWCSNTAVLVLAGVGAALGMLAWTGAIPERRRLITWTLVPWALSALAASMVSRHVVTPATMAYMQEIWRNGFPPTGFAATLRWAWPALCAVFGSGDSLRYPILTSLFAVASLGGFAWLRRPAALILAAPIAVTAGAALVHFYPFQDRAVLFLVPILLLTTAAAAGALVEWARRRNRIVAALLATAALVPACLALALAPPVYHDTPERQLLGWLVAHRQPGDAVLVWYRFGPTVAWYGERYGLRDFVKGGCWPGAPRRFLSDLDPLRGQSRVWLLIGKPGSGETDLLLRYADRIGVRRGGDRIVTDGATDVVWLYDFSDSARLQQATAADFPMEKLEPQPWRMTACTAGPMAPRTGGRAPG